MASKLHFQAVGPAGVNLQIIEQDASAAAKGNLRVQSSGRTTHVSVSGEATTTADSIAFDVDYIVFISNDGDGAITFNIDAETDQAGAFTLEAGEVLSDFPRACTTLHFEAASDTQAFRALGVM